MTTTEPEPAEGQVPAGDWEPVPDEVVVDETVSEGSKSNKEIASEVIAGHWGRGNDRKQRLQEAGYDVAAVSEEISKIYNQ